MNNQYDTEFLQNINDNVDLLSYIQQTTEVQKKGDNYFCHCPKHIDKTPSLCITPLRNSYYCFSCGRHGQIISYLRDYEGLNFNDAVTKAANLAEIDMSKMCASETVRYLKRLKAKKTHKRVAQPHIVLDSSCLDRYDKIYPQAWLDEGITKEAMDRYGILMDTWNNRIVYPVYDLAGQLINVKGRTLYGNYKELGMPKYINYYKVGTMDYFQGLNISLPNVKAKNEIIIFESIKSVMKAYGWGYYNCVSAEKHTLTDEQIILLLKLKVNVVFAWDSDVNYSEKSVKANIDKLKRITNVYIIKDKGCLLGGREAKNAPVDLTKEIWETLYSQKRKVV